MANGSGVVGVLRALLTADTAQFDTSMRKAAQTTETTTKSIGGLSKEVAKLTPQAERMVKALGGDKLLASANNLTAAVQRIGGAAKLTESQQARVNATVTEAIAKYKALGQAAPQAMLDLQKATTVSAGPVKGLINALGPLGPTIAASFSAAAVFGFTRAIFDSADSLKRLHDQTQISFQGLQKLQIAGDDAGNSIDDITQAIAQFQNRLGDAKPSDEFVAALTRLGFTVNEIKVLAPERQFIEIGDALRGVEDPAERVHLAVALLGRTGAQVLPTLTRGFDDLKDSVVGMSDETIQSLDELGDAWTKFSRVFQSGAANLGAGLLDVLFPFHDVVRTQETLEKQLTEQVRARQQQIASSLPGFKDLTLSEDQLAEAEKDLTSKVRDSIDTNEKRIETMKRTKEVIDDFYADVSNISLRLEASFDKISETETIAELSDEISDLADRMLEAADASEALAQGSELDRERLLKLLQVNAPGSGPFRQVGHTAGSEIREGIADEFKRLPYFLTSSVLHSGSFINGLKALGIGIADVIVEAMIKEIAKKIIASKIIQKLKDIILGKDPSGRGGGNPFTSFAKNALPSLLPFMNRGGPGGGPPGGPPPGMPGGVPAWAGPAAGAAIGATVGYKTGSKLLGGLSGAGAGALLGFLTGGPIGALVGAGAGLVAGLIGGKAGEGLKANRLRNQDLAQFAGFDSEADKADTANPPGFHGLARLLAKYKKSELFAPFVTARKPDDVRRAFAPIQQFMASLGRNVKSFSMGGFIPPGVVQPAILHGGMYGEDITPRRSSGGGGNTYNYVTVEGMLDSGNFVTLLRNYGFEPIGKAFVSNEKFIATNAKKGLSR